MLGRAHVLNPTPPDRYELFHQVLAPAVLEWRQTFDARDAAQREWQQTKYAAVAAGFVVAVILAGAALWGWRTAQRDSDRANSVVFALRADDALVNSSRGPESPSRLPPCAVVRRHAGSADLALPAVEAANVAEHCAATPSARRRRLSPVAEGIIATASLDGIVRVWNVDRAERLNEIPVPATPGRNRGVNAVVFAPDGGSVLTAGDDGMVRKWDLKTPAKPVWEVDAQASGPKPQEEIWTAAASADGRILATAGEHGIVRLWDLRNAPATPITEFKHGASVVGLAFDRSGTMLASGGMDKVVRVWSTTSRRMVHQLSGPQDFVYGVAFAPGEPATEVAASSWDGSVWVWNLTTREMRSLSTRSPNLWGVAYSADGRLLAASGRDGAVTIWDRRSLDKELLVLSSSAPGLTGLAFNASSTKLAAASMTGFVKLWNLPSVRVSFPERDAPTTESATIESATFSPDGRKLLAFGTGTAVVFDARTGSPLQRLDGLGEALLLPTGAFAPDSTTIAVGGLMPPVRLLRAGGTTMLTGPDQAISSIAFSADGRQVAAASWDKSAWVWNLADDRGRMVGKKFELGRALAVVFSPDGQSLAVGADYKEKNVVVYDLSRQSAAGLLLHVPSEAGDVTRLAYSDNGRYLVAGFSSGVLAVWELAAAQRDEAGRSPNLLLPGHETKVTDLRFDTEATLASASDDGTTKVWDMGERTIKFAMRGHTGKVSALSFLTRAKQLTTVGKDSVLVNHPLEWREVEEKAERQGRALTRIQCQDYFGAGGTASNF